MNVNVLIALTNSIRRWQTPLVIKRKFDMAKSFKRDLKKHYLVLVGEEWTEVSNCLLGGLPMPKKVPRSSTQRRQNRLTWLPHQV